MLRGANRGIVVYSPQNKNHRFSHTKCLFVALIQLIMPTIYREPMDNVTPSGIAGPRKKTIDYIRTFARLYRPQMEAKEKMCIRMISAECSQSMTSC